MRSLGCKHCTESLQTYLSGHKSASGIWWTTKVSGVCLSVCGCLSVIVAATLHTYIPGRIIEVRSNGVVRLPLGTGNLLECVDAPHSCNPFTLITSPGFDTVCQINTSSIHPKQHWWLIIIIAGCHLSTHDPINHCTYFFLSDLWVISGTAGVSSIIFADIQAIRPRHKTC